MPAYLLDANTFIEAKNLYYGFDIVPAYWQWLDMQNELGAIASVAPVFEELMAGNDQLADWVRERQGTNWEVAVDDEATQKRFAEIAAWVMTQAVLPAAKSAFLAGADPWLIAKAATLGAVVVTHEQFAPDVKKKIPIPNVCRHFGVSYVNTFAMLRALGASF